MKTTFFSLMTALAFLPAAWTQTPYVTDANTLFLYHFDETSGSTANDSSGNGRHATYGSNVLTGVSSAAGLGQAIQPAPNSNGRVSWVDTSTSNTEGQDSFLYDLVQEDFTIEAWIRFDSLNFTGNRFIFNIQPSEHFTYDLRLSIIGYDNANYGGALSLGHGGSLNHTFTTTPYSWEVDTWYHIAVSATNTDGANSVFRFYINEAGDSTTPDPYYTRTISDLFPHTSLTQRRIEIGGYYNIADGSSSYFPGAIDEVRLSNIARTQFDTLAVIPEPSSLLLIGLALGLTSFRNRHA